MYLLYPSSVIPGFVVNCDVQWKDVLLISWPTQWHLVGTKQTYRLESSQASLDWMSWSTRHLVRQLCTTRQLEVAAMSFTSWHYCVYCSWRGSGRDYLKSWIGWQCILPVRLEKWNRLEAPRMQRLIQLLLHNKIETHKEHKMNLRSSCDPTCQYAAHVMLKCVLFHLQQSVKSGNTAARTG